MNRCLLSFVFVLLSGSVFAENSHVLVLDEGNFDEAIKNNKYILVEFYSPTCGHCKQLEPEYEKVSKLLHEENSEIILAKVDATTEESLATKFEIQGYPTLKFFKNGQIKEYDGARTSEAIIKWVKKNSGPDVTLIENEKDFEKLTADNRLLVVGMTTDEKSAEWSAFTEVASKRDEIFVRPTAQSILDRFKFKDGVKVVLVKNFDDPIVEFDREITVEELEKFINLEKVPIITEFSEETAGIVFSSEIKNHIIVFMGKSEPIYKSHIGVMQEVGVHFRGQAHVVIVDIDIGSNERLLNFFGVKKEECPTYRFIELKDAVVKYKPDVVEFTFESIKNLVNGVLTRKIKPYLQSEDIPEDWDAEPVKVLVGKNFDQVARDPSKAVFVEFYAPWCGHCKQLKPKWDDLGKLFNDNPEVIIAKMDATANEVEGIQITGFPTIKLFPINSKEEIDYGGAREIEDFKKFIEEKGGLSASVTEKVKEEL